MSRALRAVTLSMTMVMLLVACGDDSPDSSASGDSDDVRQVHLVLDFSAKGYSSPFYLAVDKGFFLDEGLSVQVSLGFGSGDTALRVGTGEGEFGFAGIPDVMGTIAEGVPLLEIAAIFHVDSEAANIGPDVNVSGPEDLTELRGVIDPDEDPERTYFAAFLAQQDLDVNDVEWRSVADAGFATVLAGEADFALDFVSDLPEWWLQDPPIEPQAIWYGPELDVYGNGLITRPEVLEEDPELVKSFVRGVMRAYEYVIEGGEAAQQESIDALFKYNPDFLEQPNAEEFHLANLQMVLTMMLLEETREHGIGYLIPEKAERTADIINEYVLDEPVDVSDVFAGDNQPLESGEFMIDNFDEAREQLSEVLGRPNPIHEATE